MANYKVAFELFQTYAGGENARVKISVNDTVLADNVEVTSGDFFAPNLFVYDVTGPAPAADSWHTIKVELLNDFFVDADNDRNLYINRIGYAHQNAEGNYFRRPLRTYVAEHDKWLIIEEAGNITDFTNIMNFNIGAPFVDQKWKYTSTEENELNGHDVGTEITGSFQQILATSFVEIQMVFDQSDVSPMEHVTNIFQHD